VRLRLVFACVLLLLSSTGITAVWQFHNLRRRVQEVSNAEQNATTILNLNNSILKLMSRLHRAADNNEGQQFEADAKRLLSAFQKEETGATKSLEKIALEEGRQKLVIESLQEMLRALPERISLLIDLARANDFAALHARLTDQVDRTDEVSEEIMGEAARDVMKARERLFEDVDRAEYRVAQTLAIGTLLSLILAGVLGTLVTRSITRPLAAIDRCATAVSRGDFNQEVTITGTDELARAGGAFNRMIRELAVLYARETEARRTAEHLNDSLRRTNDDLSVLAYSASHDLQDPLRSITIYSQKLQRRCKGKLDADAEEYIGYLIEGARRMSELIDDLLAYMKVSMATEVAAKTTSAKQAVDAAIAALRSSIQTTKATVRCGDLPVVRVEAVHLQQLFQNLIGNAIKYRSEAAPEIDVSVTERNGFWQFSVADNGIGIDPRYRKQIFGLFKRLQVNSDSPGTGIGLAICQKIVERYGGQIWIESTPSGGSDFRFTLPRA
jgi:signal transduction histidine kinase